MQVKFKVEDSSKKRQKFDVFITAVFAGEKGPILSHWPLARKRMFQSMHASKNFTGKAGEGYFFNMEDGTSILLWGLGKKSEYTPKVLRQQAALAFRHTNTYCRTLVVDVDSFALEGSIKVSQTAEAMVESIGMAGYRFEKYAGKEKKASKKAANSSIEVVLRSGGKAAQKKKLEACLSRALKIVECVHFCRDLVNEPRQRSQLGSLRQENRDGFQKVPPRAPQSFGEAGTQAGKDGDVFVGQRRLRLRPSLGTLDLHPPSVER